ncbi:MAG: hypothetical protein HGA36_03865 [Candidatus Moranbacteria bacterium]|nr:hypothetical protein [Candidatus Moranbacteria bacterium]
MFKEIIKTFSFLTVFCMLPGLVNAAPSISAAVPVTTFSHEGVVNISGSGFGVKSQPAPLQWDSVGGQISYAGLNNGDVIPFGADKPWMDFEGECPAYYKNTNLRGKAMANYSNQWNINPTCYGKATIGGNDYPSASDKLYLSWWIFVGGPAENPDTSSNKFIRLTASNGWDSGNPNAFGYFFDESHSQLFDMDGLYYNSVWGGFGSWGVWQRIEVIVDNMNLPQRPRIQTLSNNSTLYDYYPGKLNSCSIGSCASVSTSLPLTKIGTLGYDDSGTGSGNPTPTVDWGEIYVDNTLQRVEICNASTKAASNHCEIQIPQATWIDVQIQIKVNQGSFADGSTQYLYVMDVNGNTNANGHAVSFAGSSDLIAPSAPQGLSVI